MSHKVQLNHLEGVIKRSRKENALKGTEWYIDLIIIDNFECVIALVNILVLY